MFFMKFYFIKIETTFYIENIYWLFRFNYVKIKINDKPTAFLVKFGSVSV